MASPLVLPLTQCRDASLAGGKAAGLARLLAAGLKVPSGWCVTTLAYRGALEAVGCSPIERWQRAIQLRGNDREQELRICREKIFRADMTPLMHSLREFLDADASRLDQRWAVRSSATNEDMAGMSYAGLYRTELGRSWDEMGGAITAVWASVWEARVIDYMIRSGIAETPPAMAVVIQPMLDAAVAGIAYSIDPITGRNAHVTINAIRGLGRPLVDGTVMPDHYTVEAGAGHPARLIRYTSGHQHERLLLTAGGVSTESIPLEERNTASLSEQQLAEVAEVVNRVEQVFGGPVDVEWAFDHEGLWALQARPVTVVRSDFAATNDESEWSRANFKETLPEVPSPMGLSFLEYFMEAYILSHYRRLGCRIPSDVSPVRTLSGRPYLNVSLFYSLMGQLGGNPSLLVEQMGGEPLQSPTVVKPLNWPALLKAGFRMWREMRRVLRFGPTWFAEMKALALPYSRDRVRRFSLEEAEAGLDELGRWLATREVTFGIAAGVGQCLQAFSRLLPGWLGEDWRALLNAALQGLGTVISAQQILRVAELVELARSDTGVSDRLREGWERGCYRRSFFGTHFLAEFDRFVADYGHRGIGESDVMSLRMADQPEALLEVIRNQLDGPATSASAIAGRQQAARREALALIKAHCGLRFDRWLIFRWWYRRLCRFFALREANRHHLMWYSAAARNLLLHVGELLTERALFNVPEDIFFLTLQEREAMSSQPKKDWRALVKGRRAQREHWLTLEVPDTIRPSECRVPDVTTALEAEGVLSGVPVSSGRVSGPVTFVRSEADWINVRPGDIVVAPVIDPGMAPLFGIAAGVIVEMGGTLSHGAIIAREYGLPTVTNVRSAMTRLCKGDIVTIDAGQGIVRRRAAASGT